MPAKRHPWLILLCLLPVLAWAQPQVEVMAIDPQPDATLQRGEPIYLRLRYQSSEPLRFQAALFYRGQELRQQTAYNAAPLHPAGSGEALAWVSHNGKAKADSLHVRISDRHWKQLDEKVLPVDLHWTGSVPAQRRPAADWVAPLAAAEQTLLSAAHARSMGAGNDGVDRWMVIVLLMGWSVPGYFILQAMLWRRWQGGWRLAARLPLLLTLPLTAYTLFALAAGSNLWPLMMLFLMPLAFAYLLALMLIRHLANRRRQP